MLSGRKHVRHSDGGRLDRHGRTKYNRPPKMRKSHVIKNLPSIVQTSIFSFIFFPYKIDFNHMKANDQETTCSTGSTLNFQVKQCTQTSRGFGSNDNLNIASEFSHPNNQDVSKQFFRKIVKFFILNSVYS